jgi:flagellar hook assembly protein FlgD
VFDLGGRLVRTLHRGPLAAGPHAFEWNGRDQAGRRAAAGVYFVVFDSPGRGLRAKLVKLP